MTYALLPTTTIGAINKGACHAPLVTYVVGDEAPVAPLGLPMPVA
jgi:hypothetical protein